MAGTDATTPLTGTRRRATPDHARGFTTPSRPPTPRALTAPPRTCLDCGETVAPGRHRCPPCGTAWRAAHARELGRLGGRTRWAAERARATAGVTTPPPAPA